MHSSNPIQNPSPNKERAQTYEKDLATNASTEDPTRTREPALWHARCDFNCVMPGDRATWTVDLPRGIKIPAQDHKALETDAKVALRNRLKTEYGKVIYRRLQVKVRKSQLRVDMQLKPQIVTNEAESFDLEDLVHDLLEPLLAPYFK